MLLFVPAQSFASAVPPRQGVSAPAVAAGGEASAVRKLLATYDQPGRPGVAVGVFHRGRAVLIETAGYADLEHGVRVTADTRFELASVSKQFTGYAIAKLAKGGRIDLDADIRQYLPWIPAFGGATITTRQLLQHTSGIREQHELCMLAGFDCEHLNRRQQFINLLQRQTTLNFVPGSRTAYCNTGYMLLGEIVRAVTGQSLRQYANLEIFKPLGMTSFYLDDLDEVVPNRATGYMKRPDGGWSRGLAFGDSVGETGVQATVGDMIKWLGWLSRGAAGDRAFEEFSKPTSLSDGTTVTYGFGIGLEDVLGRRALSHAGGMMGNVTNLVYFPGEDLGVVVLMLDGSYDAPKLSDRIAEIYLGRSKFADVPAALDASSDMAASMAGNYLLSEADWPSGEELVRIVQDGNTLLLDREPLSNSGTDRMKLVSLSTGDFREEGGTRLLKPVLTGSRVSGFQLSGPVDQPSKKLSYSRLAPIEVMSTDMKAYAGRYCSDELDECFAIRQDGDALLASSIATTDPIRLTATIRDRFDSASWFFSKLEFVRDGGNSVVGFKVSSPRARNSIFEKR